jgi:subfamily B ATP-binding cassette protein MsbA
MFFAPILKYFKPYIGRIVFALVCMVVSSFLGTYNIVLSKPALDVLFGQTSYEEREAEIDKGIIEHQKKLKDLEEKAKTDLAARLDLKRKKLYYPIEDQFNMRVYGSSFFTPEEFRHPKELIALLAADNPVSKYLKSNLTTQTCEAVATYNQSADTQTTPSLELMKSLTQDLNGILGLKNGGELIYESARFPRTVLSDSALEKLVNGYLSPQESPNKGTASETKQAEKLLKEIKDSQERQFTKIDGDIRLTLEQKRESRRTRLETSLIEIGKNFTEGQAVRANRELLKATFPEEFKTSPPQSLYRYADTERTRCLRWIGAFLVVNAILFGLFEYGFKYNISFILYRSVIELKNDIFRHILEQDMRFFTERSVGFLMSRITNDVETIGTVFDVMVKNALEQTVRLVFLFSILMILSPSMTGIVFFLVLPLFIILGWFAHLIKRTSRKQKTKRDVLSAAMNESLGNVRLIKALATEDIECERFNRHNDRVFHYQMKQRVAKFAASPIMEIMAALGMAAILMWGGLVTIHQNSMSPSSFVIYVGTLALFYTPIKRISRVNVNWQLGVVSCERIQEMLALQATVLDPEEGAETPQFEHVEQGISVRNVIFSYGERRVLDNVSLEFRKGTVTAIVGRSGSGKTTLANLLLRLYDPDEGEIELDGYDVRTFRRKDLRSHFGIVTQETLLFDDTVANNIAYGAPDVNMERIMEAARIANAHEFISLLENGYDTGVGPAGSTLSGGQRQRIAIARAFYRNPDILLLDEATSSLDTESETVVQEAIEPLMKDRTVIVIAHRLSTIMHADNIIVLHEGKVVEQGCHNDLLDLQGHYATLYKLGEFSEKENGDDQSA